jgi:phosphoglycerate kinase
LPHAAGLRFHEEVRNLSMVFENPKRPVVMGISGVKDDKLSYIKDFLKVADKILIGGRLPEYIHDSSELHKNPKVVVANLMADKEDITIHSVEKFEEEIGKAGTIVLSGPMGKFEEEGHRQGTKRVFEAVAFGQAFKVAGGGDTQSAIKMFGLNEKFDWISVGGGAMLTFLAKGTLPGIEALRMV